MSLKSAKAIGGSAMSAAIEATDIVRSKARAMLIYIGGPLPWNGTRDAWRYKLARTVGINPRRIRAILSHEKLRLHADEYFLIERAYEGAHDSLAKISALARDADVRAHSFLGSTGREAIPEGQSADGNTRPSAHASNGLGGK